jgi:hypothetical protein
MQGDSLKVLLADLAKALSAIAVGNFQDATDELKGIVEQLREVEEHYEMVCRKKGIEIPEA